MLDEIYLARMRERPLDVRVETWAYRNAILDASPSYYSCYRPRVVAGYISSFVRMGVNDNFTFI